MNLKLPYIYLKSLNNIEYIGYILKSMFLINYFHIILISLNFAIILYELLYKSFIIFIIYIWESNLIRTLYQ